MKDFLLGDDVALVGCVLELIFLVYCEIRVHYLVQRLKGITLQNYKFTIFILYS